MGVVHGAIGQFDYLIYKTQVEGGTKTIDIRVGEAQPILKVAAAAMVETTTLADAGGSGQEMRGLSRPLSCLRS